jgi:hypothetical protein
LLAKLLAADGEEKVEDDGDEKLLSALCARAL